jgi:hypothetical protein
MEDRANLEPQQGTMNGKGKQEEEGCWPGIHKQLGDFTEREQFCPEGIRVGPSFLFPSGTKSEQ